MVWLGLDETEKQMYIELRVYSPKDEKVFLNFNPLKESQVPDWNPIPVIYGHTQSDLYR